MTTTNPPSARTEIRRGADRAEYEPEVVRSILRAGAIAHVGVVTDDGPIVLPMAYGVTDDHVLIHGSVANAMMRSGAGLEVCITVTLVDGLVIARTPFHNSMNYRSVVIRGVATRIDDQEAKTAALMTINDHIAPLWAIARPPNQVELKRTLVLSVPLTEASAKVRAGDPVDDDEDMSRPYWAGVVPLTSTWGQPLPSADLAAGIPIPGAVAAMAETNAHQSV